MQCAEFDIAGDGPILRVEDAVEAREVDDAPAEGAADEAVPFSAGWMR